MGSPDENADPLGVVREECGDIEWISPIKT